MFLPISESYQVSSGLREVVAFMYFFLFFEDMLRRVTEDFDLEEDVVLSLRTSTIDACRGREVIIPESAYIYLRKYLDEVDVSIVERAQGL